MIQGLTMWPWLEFTLCRTHRDLPCLYFPSARIKDNYTIMPGSTIKSWGKKSTDTEALGIMRVRRCQDTRNRTWPLMWLPVPFLPPWPPTKHTQTETCGPFIQHLLLFCFLALVSFPFLFPLGRVSLHGPGEPHSWSSWLKPLKSWGCRCGPPFLPTHQRLP